jgi:hypothetical protein
MPWFTEASNKKNQQYICTMNIDIHCTVNIKMNVRLQSVMENISKDGVLAA